MWVKKKSCNEIFHTKTYAKQSFDSGKDVGGEYSHYIVSYPNTTAPAGPLPKYLVVPLIGQSRAIVYSLFRCVG